MLEKHKAYSAYKNAGVEFLDVIPSGWDVLRGKLVFKEFAERSLTGAETLLSVSEYYGVKPRAIVMADGDFLSRAESLVDYKKCSKNDLVMNIMLAWKRGLGVTKFDGIVSPAYSVFRFNERASPDYMHYLLRTDTYTNHFKTRSTGVIDSRLRLYPESFGNVPVILPSINEQQKIANFLDHETAKIDTLIEKQQQLIKLLKEKRQAVISHAVTKGLNPNVPMRDSGVEWLGEVPVHWDVVPIKHIVSTPVTDGPHETPDFLDEGIPFISAEAVSSGKIRFDKIRAHISEADNEKYSLKYAPKKHDIYMVKSGATTGVTAIVETDQKFNIWSPLAVIRCKKDSYPYFVLNFMRSLNFKEAVELNWSFGTQQNIGMGVIENLHVTRPPLEEAKTISKQLIKKCSTYDNVIEKGLSQIELMKERRTALISAAVTGKIDVRNWQAPKPSSTNNKEDAA